MTLASNGTGADVYRGYFWLPARPENPIRGTLTLRNARATLRVEGILLSTMRSEPARSGTGTSYQIVTPDLYPQDVVIHGTLDDQDGRQHQEDVTLLRSLCISPEWGSLATLGRPDAAHQTWQPTEVLRGGHVDSEAPTFTSIRVRLQHIEEWSALQGFERKVIPGERIEISCTSVPSPTVSVLDGATLSLVTDFEVEGPSALEGTIRRTLWFQVEGLRPSTALELDRAVVAPLCALLTLCTGRECEPSAVKVGPWTGFPWLDLTHSGIDPTPQELVGRNDMILALNEIGIEGVGRWLDAAESLGPIPHKVASVISRRGHVIENDFHDLATAAEGLHRRLHESPKRFTKGEVEKARKALKEHLESINAELYEAVRQAISHIRDPSYKTRLAELLSATTSSAPDVAGMDPEAWGVMVGKYRDRFAHELDHGALKSIEVDELIVLKESLAWLLTARMLLVTGSSPEQIAAKISAHPRYALFVRQARKMLPSVYSPAARQDAGESEVI